jgi:hypothetical protein
MEIRKTIGCLRRLLHDGFPQLLGKASLNRSAFPHLPQAQQPSINMEQTFILKTIRLRGIFLDVASTPP